MLWPSTVDAQCFSFVRKVLINTVINNTFISGKNQLTLFKYSRGLPEKTEPPVSLS